MKAGASPSEAVTLAAIAAAESSGQVGAVNDNFKVAGATRDPNQRYDYGLWQINSSHGFDPHRLVTDPLYNAQAALQVLRSQGFGAWATYNSGAYKKYVPSAETAAKEAPAVDVSQVQGSSGDNSLSGTPGGDQNATVSSLTEDDFLQGLQDSGFAKALVNSDPQLKHVFDQAIQEGWWKSSTGVDRFKNAIKNTDWWKSRTDSQRAFDELKSSDPTQFKFDMQQAVDKVNQMAGQAGVHLTADQSTGIAQLYFRNGLDDAHVNHYIADYLKLPAEGSGAAPTGDAGYYLQKINTLAGQYFAPITDSMKQDLIRKLIAGTTTEQGLGDYFAQQAASRFPWLKDQLDAGYTVSQIADPYKARMESLLGVSATAISNDDPTLLKGLQMLTPDGKTYQTMPIYQFDQMLRQDPRWKLTPDYTNTQGSVARAFQSVLGGG